jgi:hypothetical protein
MIGLTWSQGVNNGGSVVIDYKIYIAVGTSSYTVLESGITSLSYVAINLVAGQLYRF